MQQLIKIKNSRGLNLAAILHQPEGQGRYPAVILLHGFTGYKEEPNIESLAEILVQNGFVAIRFDASGYGESEGNLENDYRLSHYKDDVQVIYDYLISQPFVDSKRVGIWGHSMGAMLSIIYASEHQDIKAICPISPPYKMGTTDLLKKYIPQWKKTGYWEKVSSKYGPIRIPYAFIEDAQQFDAIEYAKKLTQPAFMVIGNKDEIVSPADSLSVFEAMGQEKSLSMIPGMDHYYKDHPDYIDLMNRKVF